MIYLSQLLNKKIYYKGKPFGYIVDVSIFENYPIPSLSKIVVKRNDKKITISPSAIDLNSRRPALKADNVPFLPYDESNFYLNEDLLDKQVIDIDGKRLVRVNDVAMEKNGELKVIGIDIGVSGILRRLGLENFIKIESKILPWQMIEAFDYHSGNVKIKVTQSRLNSLHPSELADILEDAGARERVGIVKVLDAQKAAMAIEETNTPTQEAILEQLPLLPLKRIINRMLVSEIADIFYKLNPLRIREILKLLGSEKAEKVKRLLEFGTNTAGGLMTLDYCSANGGTTVKEALGNIYNESQKPEAIIVTNGNQRLIGTLYTKDLVNCDPLALLKDIVNDRKFAQPNIEFSKIFKIFTQYNLRLLPVVDKEKKPIGVITVDTILKDIEENRELNEAI